MAVFDTSVSGHRLSPNLTNDVFVKLVGFVVDSGTDVENLLYLNNI